MVNEPEDEFDPNEFKDNNCDSSVFRVPSSKSKVRVTRDETRGGSAELRNEVVMPPEFYQEVDTFLSREPPKLKKTSLASAISSFTFASSDQLSTHNRRGSKRAQTESSAVGRGVIDENLLRDAFAYRTTEDIYDEEDGVNESQRRNDKGKVKKEEKASFSSNISRRSSRGEDLGTGTWSGIGTGTGAALRGSNGTGIVQKLRSQTASSSNSRCSSPTVRRSFSKDTGTDGSKIQDSTASDGTVERRGQYAVSSIRRCSTGNAGVLSGSINMDVAGMVSDFESGSTMRRLQRELTASKHSLDRSTKAIETISNSYLSGDLGPRK